MKKLLQKLSARKDKSATTTTTSSDVKPLHKFTTGDLLKVMHPPSNGAHYFVEETAEVIVVCVVAVSWCRKNAASHWRPAYGVRGLQTGKGGCPFYGVDEELRNQKWTLWVTEEDVLGRHDIQQDLSAFPLDRLPLSCLSLVMYHLARASSLHIAFLQSLACKKIHSAWLDDTVWRRRCRDLDPLTMIPEMGGALSFYKQHYHWNVTILTVWANMSGTCLSGRFSVVVPANMTVSTFLALVAQSPKNLQGSAILQPFDGSLINMESYIEGDWLSFKRNCKFQQTPPTLTLQEAGLCNDAVLYQVEGMMCD